MKENQAMGFPQVTSRLISAPVQALRTVFEGIGRIVTAADRSQDPAGGARNPAAGSRDNAGPEGRARHGKGAAATSGRRRAEPASASRWRSLDETGNVRLLTAEDLEDDGQPSQPAALAGGNGTASPAASTPAPEAANGTVSPAVANPAARAAAASDLPLPGYDDLTLPSIRARLRGLDTAQLRALVAYESMHAERPEVLGMFERRIEKLEDSG
jgi:pyruvate/2-oxoglutarate dehydrogenase complex dihydrolipoamide acyltransferase (E2) component